MVKGGFIRKNGPKNKKDKSIPEEEIDWFFKLSNDDIRKITKTSEIKGFCEIQHLKYIAHVTRMRNDSLQKQLLFSTSSNNRWHKLSNLTGIDETQLRRKMFDKKEFPRLLSNLTIGAPDENKFSSRKN